MATEADIPEPLPLMENGVARHLNPAEFDYHPETADYLVKSEASIDKEAETKHNSFEENAVAMRDVSFSESSLIAKVLEEETKVTSESSRTEKEMRENEKQIKQDENFKNAEEIVSKESGVSRETEGIAEKEGSSPEISDADHNEVKKQVLVEENPSDSKKELETSTEAALVEGSSDPNKESSNHTSENLESTVETQTSTCLDNEVDEDFDLAKQSEKTEERSSIVPISPDIQKDGDVNSAIVKNFGNKVEIPHVTLATDKSSTQEVGFKEVDKSEENFSTTSNVASQVTSDSIDCGVEQSLDETNEKTNVEISSASQAEELCLQESDKTKIYKVVSETCPEDVVKMSGEEEQIEIVDKTPEFDTVGAEKVAEEINSEEQLNSLVTEPVEQAGSEAEKSKDIPPTELHEKIEISEVEIPNINEDDSNATHPVEQETVLVKGEELGNVEPQDQIQETNEAAKDEAEHNENDSQAFETAKISSSDLSLEKPAVITEPSSEASEINIPMSKEVHESNSEQNLDASEKSIEEEIKEEGSKTGICTLPTTSVGDSSEKFHAEEVAFLQEKKERSFQAASIQEAETPSKDEKRNEKDKSVVTVEIVVDSKEEGTGDNIAQETSENDEIPSETIPTPLADRTASSEPSETNACAQVDTGAIENSEESFDIQEEEKLTVTEKGEEIVSENNIKSLSEDLVKNFHNDGDNAAKSTTEILEKPEIDATVDGILTEAKESDESPDFVKDHENQQTENLTVHQASREDGSGVAEDQERSVMSAKPEAGSSSQKYERETEAEKDEVFMNENNIKTYSQESVEPDPDKNVQNDNSTADKPNVEMFEKSDTANTTDDTKLAEVEEHNEVILKGEEGIEKILEKNESKEHVEQPQNVISVETEGAALSQTDDNAVEDGGEKPLFNERELEKEKDEDINESHSLSDEFVAENPIVEGSPEAEIHEDESLIKKDDDGKEKIGLAETEHSEVILKERKDLEHEPEEKNEQALEVISAEMEAGDSTQLSDSAAEEEVEKKTEEGTINESNVESLSQESVVEDPVKNFNSDENSAEQSNTEILEDAEAARTGDNISHETNHSKESSGVTMSSSLAKEVENLQDEGKNIPEEYSVKDEHNTEPQIIKVQGEKETLKSEEDIESAEAEFPNVEHESIALEVNQNNESTTASHPIVQIKEDKNLQDKDIDTAEALPNEKKENDGSSFQASEDDDNETKVAEAAEKSKETSNDEDNIAPELQKKAPEERVTSSDVIAAETREIKLSEEALLKENEAPCEENLDSTVQKNEPGEIIESLPEVIKAETKESMLSDKDTDDMIPDDVIATMNTEETIDSEKKGEGYEDIDESKVEKFPTCEVDKDTTPACLNEDTEHEPEEKNEQAIEVISAEMEAGASSQLPDSAVDEEAEKKTEETIIESNVKSLSQESVAEDPIKNFNSEDNSTEQSNTEILEDSETARTCDSISHETNQSIEVERQEDEGENSLQESSVEETSKTDDPSIDETTKIHDNSTLQASPIGEQESMASENRSPPEASITEKIDETPFSPKLEVENEKNSEEKILKVQDEQEKLKSREDSEQALQKVEQAENLEQSITGLSAEFEAGSFTKMANNREKEELDLKEAESSNVEHDTKEHAIDDPNIESLPKQSVEEGTLENFEHEESNAEVSHKEILESVMAETGESIALEANQNNESTNVSHPIVGIEKDKNLQDKDIDSAEILCNEKKGDDGSILQAKEDDAEVVELVTSSDVITAETREIIFSENTDDHNAEEALLKENEASCEGNLEATAQKSEPEELNESLPEEINVETKASILSNKDTDAVIPGEVIATQNSEETVDSEKKEEGYEDTDESKVDKFPTTEIRGFSSEVTEDIAAVGSEVPKDFDTIKDKQKPGVILYPLKSSEEEILQTEINDRLVEKSVTEVTEEMSFKDIVLEDKRQLDNSSTDTREKEQPIVDTEEVILNNVDTDARQDDAVVESKDCETPAKAEEDEEDIKHGIQNKDVIAGNDDEYERIISETPLEKISDDSLVQHSEMSPKVSELVTNEDSKPIEAVSAEDTTANEISEISLNSSQASEPIHTEHESTTAEKASDLGFIDTEKQNTNEEAKISITSEDEEASNIEEEALKRTESINANTKQVVLEEANLTKEFESLEKEAVRENETTEIKSYRYPTEENTESAEPSKKLEHTSEIMTRDASDKIILETDQIKVEEYISESVEANIQESQESREYTEEKREPKLEVEGQIKETQFEEVITKDAIITQELQRETEKGDGGEQINQFNKEERDLKKLEAVSTAEEGANEVGESISLSTDSIEHTEITGSDIQETGTMVEETPIVKEKAELEVEDEGVEKIVSPSSIEPRKDSEEVIKEQIIEDRDGCNDKEMIMPVAQVSIDSNLEEVQTDDKTEEACNIPSVEAKESQQDSMAREDKFSILALQTLSDDHDNEKQENIAVKTADVNDIPQSSGTSDVVGESEFHKVEELPESEINDEIGEPSEMSHKLPDDETFAIIAVATDQPLTENIADEQEKASPEMICEEQDIETKATIESLEENVQEVSTTNADSSVKSLAVDIAEDRFKEHEEKGRIQDEVNEEIEEASETVLESQHRDLEAATKDEVTDDQILREEKSEEQNQAESNALSLQEQELVSSTKVDRTEDGMTKEELLENEPKEIEEVFLQKEESRELQVLELELDNQHEAQNEATGTPVENEDKKDASESILESTSEGRGETEEKEIFSVQTNSAEVPREQTQTLSSAPLSSQKEDETSESTEEKTKEMEPRELQLDTDESKDGIKEEIKEESELVSKCSSEENTTVAEYEFTSDHPLPTEKSEEQNQTSSAGFLSEKQEQGISTIAASNEEKIIEVLEDEGNLKEEATTVNLMAEENQSEGATEATQFTHTEVTKEQIKEEKGDAENRHAIIIDEVETKESHEETKLEDDESTGDKIVTKQIENELLCKETEKADASNTTDKQMSIEEGAAEHPHQDFAQNESVETPSPNEIRGEDVEEKSRSLNMVTDGKTEFTTVREKELGVETVQKESTTTLAEATNTVPSIHQEEKIPDGISENQISGEAEKMISAVKKDIPHVMQEQLKETLQVTEAEGLQPANATNVDSGVNKHEEHGADEEEENAKEAKISLFDMMQQSSRKPQEYAESTGLEEPTAAATKGESEKVKPDEEKEQHEEEVVEEGEDEHEKNDSGSDAPVIVEASKDIDIKIPHKKSHNILSEVGSKVKHSIIKVKKAITGKSSHPKQHTPK